MAEQQYADSGYSVEGQSYGDYSDGNYGEQYQDGDASEMAVAVSNGDVDMQQGDPSQGDNSVVKVASDEDRKLFIGGISWDTEQKDLKEYFSKYGEVTDVNIKTDPNTGKSRGFGFVTFSTEDAVENVLKNVPHTIKGKQIDPKRAKARPGIKKIFVGGIDSDLTELDIKSYFEKFGKVESIELPFDKVKNQRRQFCFITFELEETVSEVCKQPRQKIGNKECDIKKATTKPDPRAARGGWGTPRGTRGGRGRGRGAYGQAQTWGSQAYNYSQGYGAYNQGYGSYGNYGYDYTGYGSGYGSGYSGYDYSGWNYSQGAYGSGTYGQQQSGYGKARRGTAAVTTPGYHPYTR